MSPFGFFFVRPVVALACRLRTLGQHMRHCGQRSVAGNRRRADDHAACVGHRLRMIHILTTLARVLETETLFGRALPECK